jgi:hypothetical protein
MPARKGTEARPQCSFGPSITEETPVEHCRISMRRDPTHPDADAIANNGKDEHGKYDSPNADFFADLYEFHGAHHGSNSGPRRKFFTGASAPLGLRLASGSDDRRPIDHCDLGFFGAAIRALINHLVPPAVNGGLDRADHHEAFGFAIRTIEIGRERITDLLKMTRKRRLLPHVQLLDREADTQYFQSPTSA